MATKTRSPSGKTASPAGSPPLSPRRQRFVEEYLVDLCGADAAVRAGYGAKNARSTASELLARPDVQAAVQVARRDQASRTGITADQVVRELAAVGFADIRDVVTWNRAVRVETGPAGEMPVETVWSLELKEPGDLTPAAAAMIAEVSLTPAGTLRVKLHPKVRALELLARHLGMFETLGGAAGGEDEVKVTKENVSELAARARLRVVRDAKAG